MASLKVTASVLNLRLAPVENFKDKGNVIGKLFNGAPFESVNEKTNGRGQWFQDVNGHWGWGGGLLDTLSLSQTTFDFQIFIDTCFKGQKLESEIDYNQLLEAEDTLKLSAGEGVVIGILDHPISSSLHFNNAIQRPFPVGDPLFNFHGNFIAGLIAGANEILGIANKCQLLELPIFNTRANSSGIDVDSILRSIDQDNKPVIINISNKLESRFNDVIKNFKSNKITIACAGIDEELSSDTIRDPASQTNVLAIGAITKPLSVLPKLNEKVDFVVPNFNYVSFKRTENDFARENGDSFSCAIVSALTALIISSGKCDFNLNSIKEELKKIALPFSTENFSLFNIINTKS